MKKKVFMYALEYLSLSIKFSNSDPIKQRENVESLRELIEYIQNKGYFVRYSYSKDEFVISKED